MKNNNRITNVPLPSNANDAVNCNFVVGRLSNWAQNAATSNLNMGTFNISNINGTGYHIYTNASNKVQYHSNVANIKFVMDAIESVNSNDPATGVLKLNEANQMGVNGSIELVGGGVNFIKGINLNAIISANSSITDFSSYAVNKGYLDSNVSNYLDLSGANAMRGDINMSNKKIINLFTTDSNHTVSSADASGLAVNVGYLRNYIGGNNGSGGISVAASNFGEYLYYEISGGVGNWVVGSSNIIIGKDAAKTITDVNGRNGTVSIGDEAGSASVNRAGSVAIGYKSGKSNQEIYGISIGAYAAHSGQESYGIAIGNAAGSNAQGYKSIAIGHEAGASDLGEYSIAIGEASAFQNAGINAIAIGNQAGYINQGNASICIGNLAGYEGQGTNSIVLNATGSNLANTNSNSFTVKPIRNKSAAGDVQSRLKGLLWDPVTGEIFVDA
jgi:hypothetical protein